MDNVIEFVSKNIYIIALIVVAVVVIYIYTKPVSPKEAVITLANAAISPEASSPEKIIPIADIASKAVTTSDGQQAVANLAQVAVIPESMPVSSAKTNADIAISSM